MKKKTIIILTIFLVIASLSIGIGAGLYLSNQKIETNNKKTEDNVEETTKNNIEQSDAEELIEKELKILLTKKIFK